MADTLVLIPPTLHLEYQRLLSETAHLLLRDGETDELCQTIFEILRDALQLDVYFHYLVSEDQSHLELASSGGNEVVRAAVGSLLDFGKAVCGIVAERCEWMYVPRVQERDDDMTALIRSFGIRCYSCHPLIAKARVLGTFSFGSSRRDEFDAEELDVFRIVAQQITLATERRLQARYIRHLEHQASAGRMCATIAHEINNPLETLGNLLYLLRSESLSDEGQQLLSSATAEVTRLGETMQRTLDLFRGKEQSPQHFDLHDLLREVVARLHVPKQVPVETHMEPGLRVRAVPGELRQVFLNLLINAAHFSPPEKPVSLIARRIGDMAEVQVRDQGPGINERTRRRLFQPFYTSKAGNGTGIGLWVSHEIVGRAGGTLTLNSDPAKSPGATFIVTLPLAGAVA